MQKKINSAVSLLLLCALQLAGQQSLTYNSFLKAVRDNHPLAQRAENVNKTGALQLKAAKGNFDPLFDANAESKRFAGTDYFTMGNAELRQPLLTSHYLKAGYQYGQGQFMDPEKYTPSSGLPYLGIEVNLLQGLMFDKRRADMTKAMHYADYYSAEQRIQMNELMFAASSIYADVLYTRRVNKLHQYFAALADERLNAVSELSAAGERPAVDTIEAAIFLQGRLLDRQASELELAKKANELLALADLRAAFQTAVAIDDSLEHLYRSTLRNIRSMAESDLAAHPVMLQYNAKQRVLETEKRLKREMIKPILNVSYNFLHDTYDENVLLLNTNNYKWGAKMSFPLFFRRSRHEFRMAALDLKNNELESLNKWNQLNYKRKFLLDAIKIVAGQIANAERSASYSKMLVDAERLKFQNGESSLFLLNSRESKWLETELKVAEYRYKIIKSYIELVYVNGTMEYEME